MRARLMTAQVSPEKMNEFIQLWQNKIVPIYKGQQGRNSARLLIDRQTGKAILMSLWENVSKGQAGGIGNAQGQKVYAIIGHLLTGRPVMEHVAVAGEV